MKRIILVFSLFFATFLIHSQNTAWNTTGNIGIGTTAPNTLLNIVSNTNNGSGSSYLNMRLEKNLGTNNQNNYVDILFGSNPATNNGFTVGQGSLVFKMNNTFNLSDMVFMQNPNTLGIILKSSGRVGIGVAAPTEKLQVDAGNILVRGTNNFASANDRAYVYLGSNSHYISSESGAGLKIGTTGQADLVTINQSGKVGIGNTSPSEKLQVDGGNILVRGSSNFASTGNRAYMYMGDPTHYICSEFGVGIKIGTNGQADLVTIGQSGKVGIGTGTPQEKLSVDNGNVLVSGVGNGELLVIGPTYTLAILRNMLAPNIPVALKLARVHILTF
jgi:hypothetical protein